MSMRRTAIRLFAVALAATLSWSAWAACADAAALTERVQMACCKDGEFCAPNGNAADCCKTDATRAGDAVLSSTIKPVHHISAIAVAWAVLPGALTVNSARIHGRVTALPPRIDPGPPPYIAFSSLLI